MSDTNEAASKFLNDDPLFDAIWNAMQGWVISRPDGSGAHFHPRSNADIRPIYDAVLPLVQPFFGSKLDAVLRFDAIENGIKQITDLLTADREHGEEDIKQATDAANRFRGETLRKLDLLAEGGANLTQGLQVMLDMMSKTRLAVDKIDNAVHALPKKPDAAAERVLDAAAKLLASPPRPTRTQQKQPPAHEQVRLLLGAASGVEERGLDDSQAAWRIIAAFGMPTDFRIRTQLDLVELYRAAGCHPSIPNACIRALLGDMAVAVLRDIAKHIAKRININS